MMDRPMRLLLDAFWLAMRLTGQLQEMDESDALYHGHRLLRITGKSWERFRRRRKDVG